jgi:hypothetical protein
MGGWLHLLGGSSLTALDCRAENVTLWQMGLNQVAGANGVMLWWLVRLPTDERGQVTAISATGGDVHRPSGYRDELHEAH